MSSINLRYPIDADESDYDISVDSPPTSDVAYSGLASSDVLQEFDAEIEDLKVCNADLEIGVKIIR